MNKVRCCVESLSCNSTMCLKRSWVLFPLYVTVVVWKLLFFTLISLHLSLQWIKIGNSGVVTSSSDLVIRCWVYMSQNSAMGQSYRTPAPTQLLWCKKPYVFSHENILDVLYIWSASSWAFESTCWFLEQWFPHRVSSHMPLFPWNTMILLFVDTRWRTKRAIPLVFPFHMCVFQELYLMGLGKKRGSALWWVKFLVKCNQHCNFWKLKQANKNQETCISLRRCSCVGLLIDVNTFKKGADISASLNLSHRY